MKKVVRLNENDIEGLVKKIMRESAENYLDMEFERMLNSAFPKSPEKVKSHMDKFGKLSTQKKKEFMEKFSNSKASKTKSKLKENEFPRGGIVYGDMTELVDDVINRIKEYGEEYIEQLQTLNSGFPSTKYKRVEPERNIVHSPGVKVRSTVYPK